MFRFAVIIINFRTPQLVIDCLASLANQLDATQDKVVIVDNESADNSLSQIQTVISDNNWSSWVDTIESGKNGGFSFGNNVGIKAVEAHYYWLTNSDTLFRPNAIADMLAGLDAYPEAGLVGPRLEWPDEEPQISCFRYESPISELIKSAKTGPVSALFKARDVAIPVVDEPMQPEWISFASVVVRREVFDAIGLMDEGFFMYFEDGEFGRRAREAGWNIVYWPQSRVVHLRGGSSNVKKATESRKRRPAYYYAARSRYFALFYGVAGLWLTNVAWGIGRLISLLRETVGNKEPHTCENEWQDIWTNWRTPLKSWNT